MSDRSATKALTIARRSSSTWITRGATPAADAARMISMMSIPSFARDAIRRVLDEEAPASDRAPVPSHNDVNPTNLVYDGERIVLLDWDVAAPNEPLHDLAAIAMVRRMDDASARALLAAHDDARPAAFPPRFTYLRRLIAVMCGAIGRSLARASGYTGAGDETIDTALALGDFYAKPSSGALSLGNADGRWAFGLALIKESLA